MSAELRVESLSKRYGPVVAVGDVSLAVSRGEIFGLLGPNGAGKTTTIECILGLRRPDGGRIFIDGLDALAEPEQVKRIIGAQLQATALQEKLTPREALKFFGAFYRNALKPDQLIERFSLGEKADSPFDSLSAGQKQRLALALAFVNDPRLIFLDEPTAGLDAQSRRELHRDIQQLQRDGKTVVLSTHYIEEAQQLCGRIAIINQGRIVAEGAPDELIHRSNLPQRVIARTAPALAVSKLSHLTGAVHVSESDGQAEIATENVTALVISLTQLIAAEHATLLDLRIHQPTLEDAYLQILSGEGSQAPGDL